MADLRHSFDFDEVDGGMLVGRAAALAEWRHRKEKDEFRRLVASLSATKWAKENPERRKANALRFWRKYWPRVKDRENAKDRARRLETYKANPTVYRCQECGAEFCRAPWYRTRSGVKPSFCTHACWSRHRYHRSHPEAKYIKRPVNRRPRLRS